MAANQPDFPTADPNPARDLVNRIKHWDNWVLPYVVLPSLMAPLGFDVAANKTAVSLTLGGSPALTLHRPNLAQFMRELPSAIADAELREDRASEILMQTTDTWSFFATVLPFRLDKTPFTCKLMAAAQELALHVEMRFKHEFACARPNEYSAQIQPMIPTPLHGTYPMGHMCEAAVISELLIALIGAAANPPAQTRLAEQLRRLALRIGENRIVAGVHFNVDLLAGQALGEWLAKYFIQFCSQAAGSHIHAPHDEFIATASQASPAAPAATASFQLKDNQTLRSIWGEARAEWAWMR